ncbi:hypothetical protein D1821_19065 (plasmid) [Phaeobacter inhibens]|uniref:hypothetical protein n=1 Tax=Phaeobacter TaxID=302485 RepID=UPI000160CE25|nr:hypothetical protein [Phaeobacter inhibens]AXT44586.1 hypothetical protein D1821_19065 [Phaeobacter inhibens]
MIAKSLKRGVLLCIIAIMPTSVFGKDITYIDKRVRSEPQEYAVAFSAYDGEFGHAYVTVIWGDEVQRATFQKGVGFYPGDSQKDLKVAFGGQGVLSDDTWGKADVILSVLVNKEVYEKALLVISEWEKPTPYFLGFNDCTTFVQQMSEAVGLTTPSRMFAPYPIDFLKALVSENS